MKRILHIVGTMDRAGAETMVMNLYRAIDKSKYQFDFVYFTDKTCAYDDEILALGGRIYKIPKRYKQKPITRTFKLYQLIKKNKPFHAIHCHQLLSNSFHLIAGYFAGMSKRIVHAHSTRDFSKQNVIRKLYQNFSKKIIHILGTDFIACGIEPGNFLFPNKKNIVFIPNAIDVDKFLVAKTKRDVDFFKIKKDKHTIMISQIGRFMTVKNHEFSIKFAQYLKKQNFNFHMFFAGSGTLENEMKTLTKELDIMDKITFLGVREDIDAILGNSDLLLMPSIYEGFPVILVESQTAGTPALISNGIVKEVDLGLDLVTFCNLDEPFKKWMDYINTILKLPIKNNQLRYKTISERGFNINISVNFLEKVYNN